MNPQVETFIETLRGWGASDASWTTLGDGPAGLPFAVSIALRLSDAIIDEIETEPTYTYFHHYRTVNAFLDRLTLQAGLWLQGRGARYIAVAASQSAPAAPGAPPTPFEGRYSHKKAACLAGLGAMGRSNLFLHRQWGPRVRLATVFTDWRELGESPEIATVLPGPTALPSPNTDSADYASASPDQAIAAGPATCAPALSPRCAACARCAEACPAGAIGIDPDGPAFDPAACSNWMKKAYQHIGRGAVCGICVRACPAGLPSR